ncbi:MORN repeat-containing protein [Desulfobacula toluolica]|uniref:MORN motif protein n=1 Tax=Desulfobacula toluolica (strain DSM 7467 / Tol2) TaxID=651182 RepID=K0NG71_DESTT|nr:MORN motif protein [Desulfobacula toluolica]CCK78793.1 MORN motif protein [Desulfobacula toluolica Tol2]
MSKFIGVIGVIGVYLIYGMFKFLFVIFAVTIAFEINEIVGSYTTSDKINMSKNNEESFMEKYDRGWILGIGDDNGRIDAFEIVKVNGFAKLDIQDLVPSVLKSKEEKVAGGLNEEVLMEYLKDAKRVKLSKYEAINLIYPEATRMYARRVAGVNFPKNIEYFKNGEKKYKGFLNNGKAHGQGTLYYENSNPQYVGQWKDGYSHGVGTLYYENGQRFYEGSVKNAEMHGQGTMYYENGSKLFEGFFKNGEMDGRGVMYNKKGQIQRKGQWIENKFIENNLVELWLDKAFEKFHAYVFGGEETEILGKWRYKNEYWDVKYILMKKNEKTFLVKEFRDGRSSEYEMTQSIYLEQQFFKYKKKMDFGESYLLDSDTNLVVYNNGKIVDVIMQGLL